jgi:ribosome maturation factor RimP
VLRLFIDRPAGSPGDQTLVGVDDCERVSRDVSAALDVADNIAHTYLLEVSSPGLDRPLRRERDFARFVGESARVRLEAGVEGRRNFSGTIRGAKDGHVEIACDGRSYDLPIDDIVRANLIPDWDREFARAGEAQPGSGSRTPGRAKPNDKSSLGRPEVPSKLTSKVSSKKTPTSNNRSAS